MKINIAIDGPSAAGKSSVADKLAERLGYIHLDTGAMYRTVAYLCDIKNIDVNDEKSVVKALDEATIDVKSDGTIYLDDEVVNDKIRDPKISMQASTVSKNPEVRARLVAMQQKIATSKGYILDGRDIGTVVLKDAEVKIFLVADALERAKRRVNQQAQKGVMLDLDEVLADINRRDLQDTNRAASPLKKADDAYLIDSSFLTLDEVVDKILEIIKEKVKEG